MTASFKPQSAEIHRVFSMLGEDCRIIAVTSACPGEGVSSLAYALARRAAASARKTLLVELNLHRPALAEQYAVPSLRWLATGDDWSAAAHRFAETGLALLPCPTGLSATERVQFSNREILGALIDQWRSEFDLVVIDCCAASQLNQGNIPAPLIASLADATVLVALAAQTGSPAVAKAIKLLTEAGAKIRCGVLNMDQERTLYTGLSKLAGQLARYSPRASRALKTVRARLPS
jgi:Mrp family chromosome partitioning ATPase